MADKIYCGSGRERKFDGGGSIISVSLDIETIIKSYNNHGYQSNNTGKRILKIDVGTRRQVGEYGDTHTVSVNTWHPDSYQKPAQIRLDSGELFPTADSEEELTF